MNDTIRSVAAALLLIAGTVSGGLVLAAGFMYDRPGATTLMAFSMLALSGATVLLAVWIARLK